VGGPHKDSVSPGEKRGVPPEQIIRFKCAQHSFLHNIIDVGSRPAKDRGGPGEGWIRLSRGWLKVRFTTANVGFGLQSLEVSVIFPPKGLVQISF
jgi:hypothetical protein